MLDLSAATFSFRGDNSGWWADVSLPRAVVSLGPSATAASFTFTANTQDGSPFTALVAKATSIPKWILGLVPLRALRAEGEVHIGPESIDIPSVHAKSTGATIEFCFAKPAWAALVDVGVFHVGLHGNGHGTGLVPFNARAWFQRESAALRASPGGR
jgi:hypothetical protein